MQTIKTKNLEYASSVYAAIMILSVFFCSVFLLLDKFNATVSFSSLNPTEKDRVIMIAVVTIVLNGLSGLLSIFYYFSIVFKKNWAIKFGDKFYIAMMSDFCLKVCLFLLYNLIT